MKEHIMRTNLAGSGKHITPAACFVRLLLFVVIFGGLSCKTAHQRVMESDDYGLKLEYAQRYMEEERYSRAKPLLKDLIRYYRGTNRVVELYFMYAEAHFYTEDYLLAAHYYNTLAETFPHSTYAEKALFQRAYSFYQISPRPSLDQRNTRRSLHAFQLFVNRFPNSDLLERSHNYMDELRRKLEIKAVSNATLYYRIGDYRAAVWAIENVLKQFPGTKRREELEFLILESAYKLAVNSVRDMQAERFHEAIEYFNRFEERFPESDNMEKAREIFDKARSNLSNL